MPISATDFRFADTSGAIAAAAAVVVQVGNACIKNLMFVSMPLPLQFVSPQHFATAIAAGIDAIDIRVNYATAGYDEAHVFYSCCMLLLLLL